MLVKYHVIFGFIFSILMYFALTLTLFEATIIFLSSFLIDVDHYLWYVFNKKDLNLKSSINWFNQKRKEYLSINPIKRQEFRKTILYFHNLEFLFIVFLLSYINKIFLFIIIGLIFHLILDIIDYIIIKEPFYSKLSIIILLIKNRNKKNIFFK
jgi:hypothetical protein